MFSEAYKRKGEGFSTKQSLKNNTETAQEIESLLLDIMFFHSTFWSTGDFLEHTKYVSHYTLFPCSFSEILECSE